MNTKRCEHSAVVCGDTVYVMGGHDGSNFLDSCLAYDIPTNQWRNIKSMNVKNNSFATTVVNSQFIYTFGGHDGSKVLD